MIRITGFIFALSLVSMYVLADDEEEIAFIEEVRIVGNKDDAQQIAGSAHFIGPEELEKFARETYRMKKANEVIFLFVEEDKQ